MESLEDLVTGSLAPEKEGKEEFSPKPPLEVLRSAEKISADDLRSICKELPAKIEKEPELAPYYTAQITAYLQKVLLSPSATPLRKANWILTVAATYAKDKNEGCLKEISAWSEGIIVSLDQRQFQKMENVAIGNQTARLDFLDDFFGESLAKELAEITGVKPPTAKRWLKGGGTSWTNAQKIHLLARLFYTLRHKQNLDNAAALNWYKASWQGGKSPREMFKEYSYIPSQTLKEALLSVGVAFN